MAKQYLKIEQVAELTGLSEQTIYRRSRLKTFPPPVDSMYVPEKLKNKKHWAKTEISKWVKANAKPDKVKYIDDDKLMPEAEGMWKNAKEQAKAEADDAQVLGIMKDETVIRPAFHKQLIDYIMKWFKR